MCAGDRCLQERPHIKKPVAELLVLQKEKWVVGVVKESRGGDTR